MSKLIVFLFGYIIFSLQVFGATSADGVLAMSGNTLGYEDDNLTYTVTVLNNSGPNQMGGATVTSTFSGGTINYVGKGGTDGTDWSCTNTTTKVTCTTSSNIARDANSTFTFTITTNNVGILQNNSVLTSTTADPNSFNNNASISTTIDPSANLSITKTDSKDPVTIGESYSYTLNVTNNGPSAATDVSVMDILPNGMTYNGVTAAGWTCSYVEGKLQCLKSTLASGSSSSIIVNVTAPSVEGSIINTVSVSSLINDPDTGNNTASEQTLVNSNSADLSISITGSPDPVLTTGALAYTIAVRNNSAVSASGIQVIDILPSNLQFVSVSGTGWTCSQGQYIVCDYVQGTGVLAGGSTTSAITINVTAPATAGTVNNPVEVSSANPDPVMANNIVTATTTVNDGTSATTAGRTFSKYLQYNVYGDIKSIGNTVTWAPTETEYNSCSKNNTTNQGCKNNGFNMQFVDIDGDVSTYNSSSANLDLGDPGYEIVWAGLYWQGHIAPDATGTNTDFGGSISGQTQAQSIKFKIPGGSYVPVTAHKFDSVIDSGSFVYSGFADVTSLVHGQGTYTVANIPASEGAMSFLGSYGGWSLQVIYKDPTSGLHYKNVSIFDGFKSVPANSDVNVSIDGFVTPLTAPVKSSVSVFVADGDKWGSNSLGEHFYIYNQALTTANEIYDTASPSGNVFNSAIAELGVHMTNKNPNNQDNLGIDIHRFDVSSFVTTNQTSTRFRFTTTGDYYYVDFLGFATDMYTPVIDGFSKTATLNGTALDATSILHAGDTLTYNLTFSNTGGETAKEVEIFDDFDLDGLNSVFNVDNFDASSIKLSVKNSTAWQASPNCGYDSTQRKVWCKIAELKTGEEYTMQFAVTIKSSFSSEDDTSVTNTAYSKYKNGTTNEYVILTSNGLYGGQSNTNNAGTVLGGIPVVVSIPATGFDARETSIDSTDNNRSITTKIVNKPFQLNVVSLNTSGSIADFQGLDNTRVYLSIFNTDQCSLSISEKLALLELDSMNNNYVEFDNGDLSSTAHISLNFDTLSAGKDKKIAMSYSSWSTDFNNANFNCSNSNTDAVLKGVPQCLNANGKIEDVYGAATALECTGYNSAHPRNPSDGTRPACESNSYNAGNLPDSPYNNAFGCYQCITGNKGTVTCSTDEFAIRPDRLDVNSTNAHFPNLLRSAEDYSTTINAYNYNTTTNTADYNVTNANTIFSIDTKMYDRNNVERNSTTTPVMHGTSSFATSSFNMSNGASVKSGFTGDVVDLMFDDVGKIKIHLEDRIWSVVDNDDTPMNCNANGTYVCGDKNVTFIPDGFDFNELNITNNNGSPGSFTYIANEVGQMAGRIHVQIRALNKDGIVTQNFAALPLWENNITITPEVTSGSYLHPDANETTITDLTLGFTAGTKTIGWNETNTSQYLRFNFQRDFNPATPPSPFDVNGSDLNILAASTYTDPEDSEMAFINGSRNGTADGKSTFVYGRIIPRDIRVFGANTPFTANGWYEVYNATSINATPLPASRNDANWYTNTLHSDTVSSYDGDGNVTVVNTSSMNVGGAVGADGIESYNFAGRPIGGYKAHINTDPWLWYGVNALGYLDPVNATNLDCLTHPCFNINVVPELGATGSAKSGAEGNKASKKSDSSGWRSTTDYAPAVR